jgi:hypothetical protein
MWSIARKMRTNKVRKRRITKTKRNVGGQRSEESATLSKK